jgi:hypothetical protein
VGRSALPLPRYTVRRRLKDGKFGHFFQVPSWARKKGCVIENEALGTDYDQAILRAEKILLPAFDSWRTGGEDANPAGVGIGLDVPRISPNLVAKNSEATPATQSRSVPRS